MKNYTVSMKPVNTFYEKDGKLCVLCKAQGVTHWLPQWCPTDIEHDVGSDHLIRVLSDLAYFATLPQGEPGLPGEDP